jgi:glutathione S-transferase
MSTNANSVATAAPKEWEDISSYLIAKPDKVNGPTNPQATLRLFGHDPKDVRVTLYRDHHAWCPYCQKIWLYLEEHKIPYAVKKVTMFCYGDKESWYRKVCPSGMLPALSIDGQLITESDVILINLDAVFGPVPSSPDLDSDEVYPYRRLERKLFGAWCDWLCRRHVPLTGGESRAAESFKSVAAEVDSALGKSKSPFFLDSGFSIADIIFTPYIERMSASLTYYKGFSLRASYPNINAWFTEMEKRPTYLGESDIRSSFRLRPL